MDSLSEPPRLPPTTFAPKPAPILARRQTHLRILVIATERANRLAWKNRLRLVDLLGGLVQSMSPSSSPGVLPPFRSVTRSLTLHWSDLAVDFIEAEDVAGVMGEDDAQRMLAEHAVLKTEDGNLAAELELLEDQVDNLLVETETEPILSPEALADRQSQLEQVVKDAHQLTSSLSIPWLWRFRTALDATTDGLEHDLLNAPQLCLLVATTGEDLPIMDTLANLASEHYLPLPYHNGLLDPTTVRKEVLVLHDTVDGPKDWDEGTLRQSLFRRFGNQSAIVRLNSIALPSAALLEQEEDNDLWNGGGRLGNCLSVSDRVVIRKYLAGLITSALLPAVERRIADLNVIVSDRKKGVKNVLKSLWGGGRAATSSKDEDDTITTVTSSTVKYRHDSVESQTRLLADLLFLMKDYEAALSMYRLIKDDFKQDKAMAHYGSVQEMMALCMYQMDPYGRSKEIFSNIENALLSYSRAADEERPSVWGEKPGRPSTAVSATRLATRLCLVLVSTSNICNERHLEVADLLASASSHETSLGAAVLLEQSSSHYFQAEMYRKYAFHMLMAGHMFRSAEQEHHAFRCFTSALYIYRDSKWEELHNHLRSALAAQLYSMGRMAVALQLYAKLVGSTEGGRVSSKSQQKFVNHLLEICNEHPKKALVGADRMAASSKLSGAERDAVRKERLDRIVQVIRYTKSASRVLELPNIDLPGVHDSTVAVVADETAHLERVPCFGFAQRGTDEIWDELELSATAELKAIDQSTKAQVDDDAISSALAKIDDPMLRRVVALIDKEKFSRSRLERAKRSATHKENPPVRAEMEPLVVEFAVSNPLAIPIDLADMQVVARMTSEDKSQICTNEDAIKITPLRSYDKMEKWTFNDSHVEFEVPDFCRLSTVGGDPEKQSWKAAEELQPLFVVTKASMTLEPESQRTVFASICPIRQGNLEIIGVRCRLLDDVWVFHPFNIKGELLQNTRSNRANRVRAEPMMLKAKVERGMPCLTAELVHASFDSNQEDRPLLQGQIGSWSLRLSNVGTAAAKNVYLKTNLPWVKVTATRGNTESCPAEELEGKSAAFCVGPTGTLMELPIEGEGLKNEREIQPGESIEVPIHIRPNVAGKLDFYMLFQYQLVDEEGAEPRCRWLRKCYEVPVYPSISLSAAIVPSFSDQSEHILSLEMTNNRTDRPDHLELVIDTLSLASRCYRLEPMAGQVETTATLGWQERITVHYRVVGGDDFATGACILSECNLNDETSAATTIEAVSSHLLDFLCLESAHDEFNKTLRSHKMAIVRAEAAQGHEGAQPRSIAQIRRANTSTRDSKLGGADDDDGHPTSIVRLLPRETRDSSVCLVCSWRDADGKVKGAHFIRSLQVRPAKRDKGCPITVTAEYPAEVTTDLDAGPASVPLSVKLRNRLVDESVEFKVKLDRDDSFDFVGPEVFKSALSGGEELSIPLEALIPATGVYNLQKVKLTVVEGEDESKSYVFPMQWIVTVGEQ